jgi:hypothetical protein
MVLALVRYPAELLRVTLLIASLGRPLTHGGGIYEHTVLICEVRLVVVLRLLTRC